MYELIQVGEKSYYINCPAKIGVFVSGDADVCLIDSGNDKEAGRKVRQVLEKHHWNLKAILNTHSNADHIGGNHYLQNQTGCPIFANGIEADFIRHPLLEPSFLYGGYPCKDLRHKFLLAQESRVCDFSDGTFPEEIEVIPLPGHFFDMTGFRTPDDTVFLADCISSKATLDKYGIPFIYDVAAYLQTLDKVESLKASVFVPAHADASKDILELVQYNRIKVNAVTERLLEVCKTPMCFDMILQAMFSHYELVMNFEQYVLVGSTIRSYLSWMKDSGDVAALFEKNMLLWYTIS